jgi:fatty acid desaturase
MASDPPANRHAPWIQEAIRAGQRYHYRTKSPWLHNAINLGALALCLGVLCAVAWAGTVVPPLVYVPIASVLFGWTYFAMFVLVVHEASHWMFVVSRNRRIARALNRAFGWPVAVLFAVHYGSHWERGHLEHHVRPLEPADPQQYSILIGKPLFVRVLCDVFVPGFLFLERTVFRARRPVGKSASSTWVIVAFVLVWALVLTLATAFLGWPVAVALFIGIHVLAAWNHVKGGLEHGGEIGHEASPYLRSRTSLFFARWLLMPFNITLHFEHHLNYCIPWYDLGRYHRDLRAIVPAEVWADVVNPRPLRQLAGALGGLSGAARELAVPK